MHSKKIRDLKKNSRLWIRIFWKTQRAPNLHNPLNLEHKSLQDVYWATQSESIRAGCRPVEFTLFRKKKKKKTREGTRGYWGQKGDWKRRMCVRVLLLTCFPQSSDFPKKLRRWLAVLTGCMTVCSWNRCIQCERACVGPGQPGPRDLFYEQ